jgi:hypothetical protein
MPALALHPFDKHQNCNKNHSRLGGGLAHISAGAQSVQMYIGIDVLPVWGTFPGFEALCSATLFTLYGGRDANPQGQIILHLKGD